MTNPLHIALQNGIEALGLVLSTDKQRLLLEYLQLLKKWNTAYNLTAIGDPTQMVHRHLLDSLAIATWCVGDRLIDVGSGAGLPGIPLAIMFPEREIHLLDSNGKKTRFLFQVKTALSLANITVHNTRVELHQPTMPFDVVLSRAFASLFDMVNVSRHLLGSQGRFLAMKGANPRAEIEAVRSLCKVKAVRTLSVPNLNAQRHLVELTLR
ncbi:MAG: 16S rRNA (guanine(527)-N(7))-methyltransferase RsmG [Halieaceae bacterium]|nr:16S rRNA (guanine(527)-N(7))-methyltransferase RsmG [Halieaceae bacterium]